MVSPNAVSVSTPKVGVTVTVPEQLTIFPVRKYLNPDAELELTFAIFVRVGENVPLSHIITILDFVDIVVVLKLVLFLGLVFSIILHERLKVVVVVYLIKQLNHLQHLFLHFALQE